MTNARGKGKVKEVVSQEEILDRLAGSLKITQEDVEDARRATMSLRKATMEVPGELRLGQAIVNALGHLHGKNRSIPEDPLTSLFYVTDQDLQKAINEFHKPYGFGND